eukprot:COSAG03_NODE_449_length_7834_cov_7.818746_7_plen_57_part_00
MSESEAVFKNELSIKTVQQLHDLTADDLSRFCDPRDAKAILDLLVPESEYTAAPGA